MRNLQPSARQTILFLGGILPPLLLLYITIHLLQYSVFDFDMRLMRGVHQFVPPCFDQAAIALSYLGGLPVAIVLMLFLVGQHRIQNPRNAVFIFISVVGAASICWLLKIGIDRPRPMLWPRLVYDYGASFPSGHSVYASVYAAIFILLSGRTKWRFAVSALALAWMILMGLSRVYLGVHYPSDVLAGWALGWGWVFLVYFSVHPSNH